MPKCQTFASFWETEMKVIKTKNSKKMDFIWHETIEVSFLFNLFLLKIDIHVFKVDDEAIEFHEYVLP